MGSQKFGNSNQVRGEDIGTSRDAGKGGRPEISDGFGHCYAILYKRDCIITRAGGEIYTAPFTNVFVTIWSYVVGVETLW